MSNKRSRHVLQALMATGTLLLLGCSEAPETGRTHVRDYAAEAAGDEQDANVPPKAKRPVRRMRTSLSLPYFSFAQSLNPRS